MSRARIQYGACHVGGNQNAADGGIDVRIALPPGTVVDGYVPRPQTGFQVKAQDMPAGEITEEMLPKEVIRPSIQSLADHSGAYVIVSSQGSTADTALTSRREAMIQAKKNLPNEDRLFVDFYDRTRVASWVRSHVGLIPWVRGLVGRAVTGWQSSGAWAYAPEGVTSEYLVDEKLRVHPVRLNPTKDSPRSRGSSRCAMISGRSATSYASWACPAWERPVSFKRSSMTVSARRASIPVLPSTRTWRTAQTRSRRPWRPTWPPPVRARFS